MKKGLIILSVLAVFYVSASSQSIIYVKTDASGSNNGTSWINAYNDLQSALSNATAGDTIWVAAGTYKPTTGTDRHVPFSLVKHVPVYGGFTGTETNLLERDFVANTTILSGDIGTQGDNADNSYSVVFGADSTVIDGFTITDGYADDNVYYNGGGINSTYKGKNLTIRNCIFKNNYAKTSGNAIYNQFDGLEIENCTFTNNNIYNNGYVSDGGAIYSEYGDITILNCTFTHNSAQTTGGAISVKYCSSYIYNTLFYDNKVGNGNGGAIYNGGSSGHTKLENCVFYSNSANNGNGGGVYAALSDSVINCTFYKNICGNKGGNFADEFTSSDIVNTIFLWGNANSGTGHDYYNLAGNAHHITYSWLTYESLSGEGLVFSHNEPFFVDANNLDFNLLPGVAGIDAGNGTFAPILDKAGNARYDDIFAKNIGIGTPDYTDIGAYECHTNSPMHGTYEIGTTAPLFHTFNQAVDSLLSVGVDSAVIFNVQSDTYNEQVNIPLIDSVSADNTITFQSASGDSTDVVLSYSATNSNNYTLFLNDAQNIVFKNITIKAENTSYPNVVLMSNGAVSNRFEGNIIEGIENVGQLVYKYSESDSNNVFTNNLFENGKTAMRFDGKYNYPNISIAIKNNRFINQSDTAIAINSYKGIEISGNTIASTPARAVWIDNLNVDANITIEYNNIHIISGEAISVSPGRNKVVINANSIIIDNGGTGINVYNLDQDTVLLKNNFIVVNTTNPDYATIINNDFDHNSKIDLLHNTIRVTGSNVSSACLYTNDVYSVVSYNNIFSNEADGYILTGTVNNNRNSNCYFTNGNRNTAIYSNSFEYVQYYGINYPQYNSGSDTVSIFTNPYFTADSSYIPQNQLLNGVGDSVGIAYDINGNTRDLLSPDLGAYEFTPVLAPMHGTYTIGSVAGNFPAINPAIDTLTKRGVDGAVTFNIENGTYTEQIIIPEIYGTSSTNTVTFRSASDDSTSVVLTYTPVENYDTYVLQLYRTNFINIRNITIKTESEGVNPVSVEADASNNTLQGNMIMSSSLNDNLIHKPSNYFTDSNNVYSGNYFVKGATAINFNNSKNNVIADNVFSTVKTTTNGCEGMEMHGNIINIKATKNGSTAISSMKSCKIYNNTVNLDNSEQNYSSCNAISIDSYSGENSLIAYNTVLVKGSGNSLYIKYGKSDIFNNILIAEDYGIRVDDTTGCQIDHNIYYSGKHEQTPVFANNDYRTLKEWQNNYHFDFNTIVYKPDFDNDSTLYSDDSWLNNRGVALTDVNTDINGNIRSATAPDIGAFEFNGFMPLSGEYTLGTGGHFTSFAQAVDSLHLCGVKDSVVFKIQPGIYTEQFTIADSNITRIPDTSAIVFQSLTGDSTDVILQYQADASNNFIINLDSADYVSIKNMTLQALDSAFSVVIKLRSSSHNIIADNILKGAGNTSPVIYSANGVDNNNLIENNRIINGKYGIVFIGELTQNETGNSIIGNILTNQYSGGIEVKYQKWERLERNKIIRINPVKDTTWVGIALINCTGTWDHSALVDNNMISFNATGKSGGIHLYASDYQNIFYNSVNIFGNADESRAFNQEAGGGNNVVMNNIFYNTAGGLVYYFTDLGACSGNYNDIFTNGDNFAYNDGFITGMQSWVSTANKDNNSVSIDPIFVSDNDLHISQVMLVGKGIPKPEVISDFDGEIRDTVRTTIGADKISVNCPGELAGTYTIGNTGDFSTFSDAVLALASCGINGKVTFNVLSGTYDEQIAISYIKNMTAGDSVIFQSQSGDSTDVILQFDADSLNNYVLMLDGVDNFTFRNLSFKALDPVFGRVVVLKNHISNLLLANNKITGIENPGGGSALQCIYADQFDASQDDTLDVIIRQNRISNGTNGIMFDYGTGGSVRTNMVIDQNVILGQNQAGIFIRGAKNLQKITQNTIRSDQDPSKGIFIYYSDTVLVSGNRIILTTRNDCVGIEQYSSENTISNNMISIKAVEGADVTGYYSGWPSRLYNNTVYCYGEEGYFSYGVRLNNSSANCTLMNNNLVTLQGTVLSISNTSATYLLSDYNNLYPMDIVDWTGTTGQDAHSVSFLPGFVSDTDLHTHAALLNGRGTPLPEITDDIDGEPRDVATPDIGADEFDNPVFIAGKDTVFCYYNDKFDHADSYSYDIGYGYDSYLWSNGSDSSSIAIDTLNTLPGNNEYIVTVTTGGNNYTDTINILYDLPVAIDQTEYCQWNTPVTITASPGFVFYDWGMGDDTIQSITEDCIGC
ncbi:MAG: hypothetical protein GXO83_02670, partial [Chlorobi bacterium]|nr:hypothetical protein [Chlorobiota bacterium]